MAIALVLALILAFQWTATGQPSGARHVPVDPAGAARLEPTTPSQPFLAPSKDARAVVGHGQIEPAAKAQSSDEAGGIAADPPTFEDTAAPTSSRASVLPRSGNRSYDARGPPHLA